MKYKPLLVKIMSITFLQVFIVLSLFGTALATPTRGQDVLNKKISIDQSDVTMGNVLKKLESDYNINFVYSPQVIDPNKKVRVFSQLRPLSELLDQLFVSMGLTYEASDNVIAIRKVRDANSASKAINITGKVVDEETGTPVPGVTVRVKGSTAGTFTNAEGVYVINVPDENATIVFSILGYDTQEKVVGSQKVINVILKSSRSELNQVVVVGYGTQKRQNVTGAVASANLESFKDAPNTNFAQSLQGSVPGLNVGPVTTAGSTPTITIRGQNTINGNQNVLIILDGVQYYNSLGSINPDDIASIDILKDASSTAVYGAQAANGVMLITTRKGSKNTPPRINFSTSYATQEPSVDLRPMGREEYLDKVRNLYYNRAFLAPGYTVPDPSFNIANYVDISQRVLTSGQPNTLVDTDFDWWEAGTKRGFINDNQLSISGGGDKVSYLLSGAYTNQAGFIVNDLFKRKSIRSNIESQIFPWAKVGLQAFGSFVNNDGQEPTLNELMIQSPLNSPYNADGTLRPQPFNTTGTNPFLSYDVDDKERHNTLFANVYTQIDFPFVKGLSYKLNVGVNYRTDLRYNANQYGANLTGEAYKNNEQYSDYTIDNILTYNRSFNKHSITATALYGAVERQSDYFQARATGFTRMNLGYNNLNLGALQFTNSNAWQEALNYQMARVNYAFDGRYLLTATIRRDGFSGFAANNKFATFPSLSLGWVLNEENFAKSLKWLNYAKLRVGYGVSGNLTSRYFSLDRVTSDPAYVFGDGGTTQYGQFVATLPNPDLRWERTTEYNVGLDFTVLNNRITGSFDYYNRRTKDLLFPVEIPTVTGYDRINTNVGEVANKGFELSLTSKNIQSSNGFNWSTTVAVSRNVNKVVALLGTGDLVSSNLFIGQPIYPVFDYRTNGIYQLNEVPPPGFFTGNIRVEDINGDGLINTNDREILGATQPAYRFSVLNTFKYKKLSLTVFVNSIQGGSNGYLGNNTQTRRLDDNNVRWNHISGTDFWSPSNPNGRYPSFTLAPAIAPALFYDRSFVRLQDVTLSYQIDGKIFQKAGIKNLNVFASGKNLYTWTNWQGWDPEIGNGGMTTSGRPLLKGYSLGLNVTF